MSRLQKRESRLCGWNQFADIFFIKRSSEGLASTSTFDVSFRAVHPAWLDSILCRKRGLCRQGLPGQWLNQASYASWCLCAWFRSTFWAPCVGFEAFPLGIFMTEQDTLPVESTRKTKCALVCFGLGVKTPFAAKSVRVPTRWSWCPFYEKWTLIHHKKGDPKQAEQCQDGQMKKFYRPCHRPDLVK